MKARDLLDWNDRLPDEVRVVEEAGHGATPTFMVVLDYGWAETILCGGCYQQGAETIRLALYEAMGREAPEPARTAA